MGAASLAVLATATLSSWTIRTEPAQILATERTNEGDASTMSLEGMPSISYDLSDVNLHEAKEELVALLGADRLSTNLRDRIAHSSTAWSEAPNGALDRPAFIVAPESTSEVSEIVKVCHRRRIPIIGYSGGTSLEGTLAAIHGGVCIDFKLMNKVLSLNKDDVDVVVQPGVGYEELNNMIAEEGLFFPPDPGPGAKIGGMISQGCSGTNAYRYGTVKDWVLGLTIVLADGTVVKTRGRPRKSSSGYQLTQIMVSSEGTLGLITEASLKLTSKPKHQEVAVAAFSSTQAAVSMAVKIVKSGMTLGAIEMLDEVMMRAINESGYCHKVYDEVPHLFFKFAGASEREVQEQTEKVKELAGPLTSLPSNSTSGQCLSFEVSASPEEASSIWAARKTALWSMMALKENHDDDFLSSDTAVPIGRLAEAIDAAKQITEESGLLSSYIGHVGDGNFHTAILYNGKDRAKARAAITAIQREAIKLDGTVTGEHGIGLEYRDMLVEELGHEAVNMMRQIKLALDPRCILNPDKIFKLRIN